MNNARVTFEVEGVKHSLYFGMVATEIISDKSYEMAKKGIKDGLKSLAYIIFGGLCNYAESKDQDHPEFEEAYLIAELICKDVELCDKIQSTWTESKPYEELMNRLSSLKKKADVKPSRKKPTGQK